MNRIPHSSRCRETKPARAATPTEAATPPPAIVDRRTRRWPDSSRALGAGSLLLAALGLALLAPVVIAERPVLSADRLAAESTHVVVGRVVGIYSKTESRPGDESRTRYLLEIEIESCEKGDGLDAGELVYARCWRRAPRAGLRLFSRPIPPGPSGHVPVPGEGDRIRAWLAKGRYGPTGQTDEGFAVVYPNGVTILPTNPADARDGSPTDPSGR
jgi:hypothetical protein